MPRATGPQKFSSAVYLVILSREGPMRARAGCNASDQKVCMKVAHSRHTKSVDLLSFERTACRRSHYKNA
eukprot:652234-Pleurochrysis_carterae.AAC.1